MAQEHRAAWASGGVRSPSWASTAVVVGQLLLFSASCTAGSPLVRIFPYVIDPMEHPLARRRAWVPDSSAFTKNYTMMEVDAGPEDPCDPQHLRQFFDAFDGQHQLAEATFGGYDIGGLYQDSPSGWQPCLANVSAAFRERGWVLLSHTNYSFMGNDSSPGNHSWNVRPVGRLIEEFGKLYQGANIGEKDGAFVWYVAMQLAADPPTGSSRWQQYLQFYSFMEGFNHNVGGAASSHGAAKLTLMSGEWIGAHVSARTGLYTLLSNEGAQGLPNDQLFFSHLRGAAKQHAAAIWSDISLYGVQGSKCYDCDHDPVTPGPLEACCPYEAVAGPLCGTSLILLKRLFYHAMMYNAWIVGSDDSGMYISAGPGGGPYHNGTGSGPPADGSSTYYNRTLDPIGRVMQDAHDFSVRVGGRPMRNPGLGVMLTPIALITDPMQGFIPPRTNYNPSCFQTWGNRPYEPADYFTHACYDLLYPGYADCAYFLDEKGYTTPTPYGDGADVLTSDVMPWVLSRYSIALVVSGLEVGLLEVRMKLRQFVMDGGSVVITADNLLKLPPAPTGIDKGFDDGGLFGVWGIPDARTCRTQHPANTAVALIENSSMHSVVVEPFSWVSCELHLPDNATTLATTTPQSGAAVPVAVAVDVIGGGRLVVLTAQSGVASQPAVQPSKLKTGKGATLQTPFPMLRHVRRVLDRELRRTQLFEAGKGLAHITNQRPDGSYVVALSNPGVRPLKIGLRPVAAGAVVSVVELEIGRGESELLGYLPCGAPDFGVNDSYITGNNSGSARDGTIRGGDVRIFVLKTQASASVETVRRTAPPSLPLGIGLPIRSAISLRQEIIKRPSFLQHFDTIVMDSDWLGCSSVGTSMPEQWGCSPAQPPTLVTDRFWLSRNGPGPRGLRVFVDISKLISAYTGCQMSESPGALENDAPPPDSLNQTKAVLRAAFGRAADGGASDVIFRTHMMTLQDSEPDDPTNATKMHAQFVSSVRWMCDEAAKLNVTLYMRQQAPPFLGPMEGNLSASFEFVKEVGRPNLRLALSTAAMATLPPMFTATEVQTLVSTPANKALVGALLVSTSEYTFTGDRKSTSARVATSTPVMTAALANYTQAVGRAVGGFGRSVPILLDAILEGQDQEYAEAVVVTRLVSRVARV